MNKEEMNLQVEKIRKRYAEKDEAEKGFDALREIDREVKRPARFSHTHSAQQVL